MNARFYFRGPALDMGSTCSFSHTALHRVAAIILSHLQKSQSISIKFYSVNARFYFQGPTLDMGPTCMSNLLAGSNGVVWYGFYLVWVGLE